MAVELRKRCGRLLAFFYARVYHDGVSKVINTGIRWRGTPPPSLRQPGDPDFEASRQEAEAEAARLRETTRARGRDTYREARILEAKTGERRWKDTAIANLPDVLKSAPRRRDRAPRWEARKAAAVADFVAWCRHRKIKTALGVTDKAAAAYIDFLQQPDDADRVRTTATIRSIKMIVKNVLSAVLPADKTNPFERLRIETPKDDREIHRTPLSATEIERLLDVTAGEPLIHNLIVTALSTGLRRGDVCRLKWADVDLRGGVLHVETSKTGAEVYLPIMPRLRSVLEACLTDRADGATYVFPEAARRFERTPAYLTGRIKRAFAIAFAKPQEARPAAHDGQPRQDLAQSLPRVIEAIQTAKMGAAKRDRLILILKEYARKRSYRQIQEAHILSRGSISMLLHEAQDISGVRFLPDTPRKGEGIKHAIREVTRANRAVGRRAASLYDFHALRTTFVTQALLAGMSIDKLKALTGHTTVDLVLRHYFKPKGTDVARDLEAALPAVLTRQPEPRPIAALPEGGAPPAAPDPLAEIAARICSLTPDQRTALADLLRK